MRLLTLAPSIQTLAYMWERFGIILYVLLRVVCDAASSIWCAGMCMYVYILGNGFVCVFDSVCDGGRSVCWNVYVRIYSKNICAHTLKTYEHIHIAFTASCGDGPKCNMCARARRQQDACQRCV